jgi:hypothetical protein
MKSSFSSPYFYFHHSIDHKPKNNYEYHHDNEIQKQQGSNPKFKPYSFFVHSPEPNTHNIMNKHYSSPSSHHSFDKPKNSHDHYHQQTLEDDKKNPGSRIYSCEFCHKTFTSGKSLGGHKTIHRSSNTLLQPKTNKQIHDHAVNNGGTLKKTTKITWVFSSSLHKHNHDDGKLKNHTCDVCNKVFSSNSALNGHMRWHTQKGSKKGVIIHSPTAPSSSEQSQLEFLPSTDLSKYLPPISYKTKKRSPRRRRIADNDEEITIAAKTLLYMSYGGYEGSTKRQKISSNTVDDNEKMKEQGVLLTRCVCHNEKNLVLRLKIPKDKIFQTSQDCKEPAGSSCDIEGKKNINEEETELGSRVVRNFDLNELPSDDFEDETS